MDLILIINTDLVSKLFFNYRIKNKARLIGKKLYNHRCKKLCKKDLMDLELGFLFQSFGSQATYMLYRARAPFLPYYLGVTFKNGFFLPFIDPCKILSLFFRLKQSELFEDRQDLILKSQSLEMLDFPSLDDAGQSYLTPYPPIKDYAYRLLVKSFDDRQLGAFYFNLDFTELPIYESFRQDEKREGILMDYYLFPAQGLEAIGAYFLYKLYGENVEYFLDTAREDTLLFFE